MRDLIEQAGYVQHPEALEREAILAVLREHPELIHNWWIWSGDQRWSGTTWCFDKEEDFQRFPKDKARSEPAGEQYRIYQYPKGESLVFHDKTAACAEYILRVIPWSMDRSAKFAKR